MKEIHTIEFIPLGINSVEIGDPMQGDYTIPRILVSPENAEIIKGSISGEEAFHMIVPQECNIVVRESENKGLFEIFYLHVLEEMDRCFEKIEFREIYGQIPEEWVEIDKPASILYRMRFTPKQFCIDHFLRMREKSCFSLNGKNVCYLSK